MRRRPLLAAPLALATPPAALRPALAVTPVSGPWRPERPVRILVGFAPGGAVDIVARLLGPALSERLGQPVVIENRPGAGGNIAAEALSQAPGDGHALMLTVPGPLTVNAAIYPRLPFDPERGFAPVARLGTILYALAVPAERPWTDVAAVVAEARARPGALNFSSSGTGSPSHLAIVLLQSLARIEVTHVPYRGGGPMMADFLSGKLDASIGTGPVLVPLARQGRVRLLGVATKERSALLPDLPAIAETVPDYDMRNWFGLVAPGTTPPRIVAALHEAAVVAMAEPAVAARLVEQAAEPAPLGPREFGHFLAAERALWTPLLRAARVSVD